MADRFRLRHHISLSWHDWGEDSVAFEQCSGLTHQFDPVAAAVIACLEDSPCSADDIVSQLTSDLPPSEHAFVREGVQATLDLLSQLAWTEPILD